MRYCALLIALLLLAGCDSRETLVIYSPHGKDLLEAYAAEFEAEHPGVVVQWLDMGSQQAFDRVRTEAANPQASIWWGAPQTMFAQAAEQGLLEPYRPTWADAVDADAHDPQDRWYGTYRTPEVIMYNHRRIAPGEAPRTWDDLLEPRFNDRIVIREPVHSGTMRTIFGAMVMRAESEEAGFRWLARLDANTRTYAADPTQLYLMMARGEADVTLWNMPDAYLQVTRFGHPFSWVKPADGTPVLVDGIAIPRNAPNIERAQQFYEFVTSQESLIDQAHRFHRIPVRNDVPQDSLPDWMRGDIPEMPMDWERQRLNEAGWMTRWREEIKGRGEAFLQGQPASESPARTTASGARQSAR